MNTNNKTDVVRARIDAKIKKDAEKVIKRIGVSHSTLINMMYRAVIAEQGIPLSLHVPNEKTKRALREARDPKKRAKYVSVSSIEELHNVLGT